MAPLVEEYCAALVRQPQPFELLLVENGSRDRSREICEELSRRFEPVRAVPYAGAGWGGAVRWGLSQARGEILCFTNSARTSAEDLLLMLLYAVAFPGVVVKADRKVRESLFRRLGSLLYNLECRALFDLPSWDVNGTPKVFPRSCDRLLGLTRDDDLLDLEFGIEIRRSNYRLVEVPIISTRRHGGRSTTSLRSALRLYLGALRLRRRAR